MSKGKGKTRKRPKCPFSLQLCPSWVKDSMGTVCSSEACRCVQIAYLPLQLCQEGFVRDPNPSAVCWCKAGQLQFLPKLQKSLLLQAEASVGLTLPHKTTSVHAVLYLLQQRNEYIGIKSYRATGTGNRIAPMTHRHVIPTLITLISSLKGGLGLNISLEGAFYQLA